MSGNFAPIVAAAAMAVLSSCGPSYVTQPSHTAPSGREAALADEVFQTVNSYRRSRGAEPLKRHAGLDELAREHSAFLQANRTQFDLHSADVGRFGSEQRASTAKLRYHIGDTGENVAAGKLSGAAMVKLWEDSTTHDANLRKKWAITGIGVVIDNDGRAFVTEMFGSPPTDFASQDLDRFRQH